MNYIGSKHKLSAFIMEAVTDVCGTDLSDKIFCDLFAGTGVVGKTFKGKVKSVLANDIEFYSYVLIRNYIQNSQAFEYEDLISELNETEALKGFIFENYSQSGSGERNYFTAENGQKIDAIRTKIEFWKKENQITEDQYFFLLASLLESADKVANTASVYGAFLKHIKKSAAKPLILEPAIFQENETSHQVFREDSNELIKKISGDILYLDPPYNARQYGANYHLLNTIAKYDTFVPKGKTGLRSYFKSDWCRKGEVLNSFEELIMHAQFRYIFLSYNNEGLMSEKEVREVMEKFGTYKLIKKKYQRFKADKSENRNHRASETFEYLHILEKR